ncbi:MAG: NHL repeat-containing protein [Gemmataceae bacterium]
MRTVTVRDTRLHWVATLSLLFMGVGFLAPARADDEKPSAPRFQLEWGKKGTAEGEFHFPIGIAINRKDEVFVSDFYNNRVQKFSAEGKFLAAFEVADNPAGLSVDAEDNLYIAHFGLTPNKKRNDERGRKKDQVSVHDAGGKLLRAWGKTGAGDGEFEMPGQVVVSKGGKVYVSDQVNRRIQVFDPRGKFLFKWGKQGAKPGEFGASSTHRLQFFAGPTFLALDSKGNLYATEARECRVQKFAPEGKPLLLWGGDAEKPGQFGGLFGGLGVRVAGFHGPMGICVDNKDRVWVCSIAGRVQQFSEKGAYLQGFGAAGTKPGQFYAPHGMAIDSRGALFVVDSFNHRIQKFAAAK